MLFVPGRLCLFGEHSDWAGGYRTVHPGIAPGRCLVAGTDQGLRAEAAPLPDVFEIRTILPGGQHRGPERFPLALDRLDEAARSGGFFSYAAGVVAEMVVRYPVRGLALRIVGDDLPLGKGLSSSAAICVLVVRAFSAVYGLGLGPYAEMEIAYAGERRAGSACGRMDQVCAFGQCTTELGFDGEALTVTPLAVGGVFHLLVVDLGSGKDTRRILADLRRCFPARTDPVAVGVREALGAHNLALTGRARSVLAAGDAPALGALMTEAQDVFDARVAPASTELAAPRLHEILRHPLLAELAWGAKGVGSQGDGCVQIVTRGAVEREQLSAALDREFGMQSLPLTLRPATG